MKAIYTLALQFLLHNKKRNLFTLLSLSVAISLSLGIFALFENYRIAQFNNAYAYSGKWDVSVEINAITQEQRNALTEEGIRAYLVQKVLSAQLDPIEAKDRDGPSAPYATHWTLALLETEPGGHSVIRGDLIRGEWPAKEGEIALPSNFIYQGKHISDGSFPIGTPVTLPIGIRISESGEITQDLHFFDGEQWKAVGEETYILTSVIRSIERKIGEFVDYGVAITAMNSELPRTLYLQGNATTNRELQSEKRIVAEVLGVEPDSIEVNETLASAINFVEASDITATYQKAGWALLAVLILIVSAIIVTSLSFHFVTHQKSLAILLANGAKTLHVALVLGIQHTILIGGALIVGMGSLLIFLLRFAAGYSGTFLTRENSVLNHHPVANVFTGYRILYFIACRLDSLFHERVAVQ